MKNKIIVWLLLLVDPHILEKIEVLVEREKRRVQELYVLAKVSDTRIRKLKRDNELLQNTNKYSEVEVETEEDQSKQGVIPELEQQLERYAQQSDEVTQEYQHYFSSPEG